MVAVALAYFTSFTSWLVALQAEGLKGQRIKITISDIVDRANGKSPPSDFIPCTCLLRGHTEYLSG